MAHIKTKYWREDMRFWLRQQQAWNHLRTIQRDGGRMFWERLTVWPKILKTPPCRTAPVTSGSPVEYHVMCHNGDWLLAVWMLKSLLIHASGRPPVVIHMESTLRPSALAQLQHHFPEARIIQPEEGRAAVAQMLLAQGLSHSIHWLNSSRILYKMFSVQAQAAGTNIIGLDPDILFFNPPRELQEVTSAPVPGFTFQKDQIHGYTLTLEEAETGLGIPLAPMINTGFVIRTRQALDLALVEELLKSPLVAKPSGHLEQTLYALCASKAKAVHFLPASYALNMGAHFDCSGLVCRHYAGASKHFIASEGMRWLISSGFLEKFRG